MKRHEFFTATSVIDKFFNTSSIEMRDGILTVDEHIKLCQDAQAEVRKVFPQYADQIMVTPSRDRQTEFAGYTLLVEFGDVDQEPWETTLVFDLESVNIDVV